MNTRSVLLAFAAFALCAVCMCGAISAGERTSGVSVLQVDIQAGITPAQSDLLKQAVAACVNLNHRILLVRLDTPGGLVASMREMLKTMLNAPVPVLVWVGPSGARAASAGVFLVAAASACAMAPQTTIGAASPVDMGGREMSETMAKKVENDLLSLVRGVASAHGRNVEWYEKAVTLSHSATAEEAAMLKVVDYIAVTPEDFLVQVGKHGLSWRGGRMAFNPEAATLEKYEPSLRYKLLSWLLDPQIAYLFLLAGMAGLFFELTNPGALFPGVVGGFSLLLGLYAMSVLPTNVAGVLLLLFSLVLFFLEIKIASYGLLSVSAVASMFVGSFILFDFGGQMPGVPLGQIIVTVAGVSMLLLVAVYLVAKAQKSPPKSGQAAIVGLTGKVRTWDGEQGLVFVRGEIWTARGPVDLGPDDVILVTGHEGLVLDVKRANPDSRRPSE